MKEEKLVPYVEDIIVIGLTAIVLHTVSFFTLAVSGFLYTAYSVGGGFTEQQMSAINAAEIDPFLIVILPVLTVYYFLGAYIISKISNNKLLSLLIYSFAGLIGYAFVINMFYS